LSAVRAELREHSVTAARALVQLLDHEDPGTRLRAIEIFYDRLCGKPVQSVENDVRTLDINQLWLQTVQQKPEPHAVPTTIDHTTTTTTPVTATTLPPSDGSNDDDGVTTLENEW
jgi:hypothetical protein